MNLSSELVSQFAKITNDDIERKDEGVTLYGEVVEYGDTMCVKLDGSDAVTPVVTTAKAKPGERVSVTIKNHTAIVNGNLDDPSTGITATEDLIRLEIGKVSLELTEMGLAINGLTTFTNGLENGTTKINGGCIETGTLVLTGSIKFSDLTSSLQTDLSGIADAASEAYSEASSALATAEEAEKIAKAITVPNYITETYIDKTTIKSPTIEGDTIKVYGTFQTVGYDGGDFAVTGYMGAAYGKKSTGGYTVGVALSNTWNSNDYSVGSNYLIVTNGGVRMQAGSHSLVVTSSGAYYDDVEIGTGTGSGGTPVWG